MTSFWPATVAEAVFLRELWEFWLPKLGLWLGSSDGRHTPGQHGLVYVVWDGLDDAIVEAVGGSQSHGRWRQPWRGAEGSQLRRVLDDWSRCRPGDDSFA
jgi:hypothetical protein